MPLPPGVVTIPHHGQILHPATGAPAVGTVQFSIPYPLKDAADKVVLSPQVLTATLTAAGEYTINLPATDQAGLNPPSWAYTVTVLTDQWATSFLLQVPVATVGTLELASAAPASMPPALQTYALWNHTHSGSATVSDATTASKGVVQLAGDLAGTAAAPTVPGLASKVASVSAADGTITVSGTATNPTVAVGTIPESKVTGLTGDLAARVQVAGDLGGTAAVPTVTGTHLASPLPITQGGTGSTTQSFVDLTTAQTIGGVKTFSSAPVVPAAAFPESAIANLVTDLAAKAPTSRLINAGAGLSGGGDLSADRTLAVAYGTTTGTACQGNDARVTGAVQAATATTKGDLLVATAAATIARLAVGTNGQLLISDSSQATGVKWADPGATSYDLSEYGFVAATIQPEVAQISSGAGHWMARIRVPAGKQLTGVGVLVTSAGTVTASGGFNSISLYDDGAANLLAQTAADDTIWTSPGWRLKDFTTPYAAQPSVWYARIRLQVVNMSPAPSFGFAKAGPSGSGAFTGGYNKPSHRRSVFISSPTVTSWPASFDPTAVGANTEYLPCIVLY